MIEYPRIVFFGTPDFAVKSLKALVSRNCHVVAVVTAPDKPAGRGLKPKISPVKEYAESAGIPVLQPPNLKDPGFLEVLGAFTPDLMIVIAFRMLPKQVWMLPPLGTFNLHASLLPQYRGAAPINRAIMNGEAETGLTTFFLNDQIDTGKIILARKFPIGIHETAGELHDRLMHAGGDMVIETVDLIRADRVQEQDQNSMVPGPGELKSAPKIFKEDCRIDWSLGGNILFNLIRGLSPSPGAFSTFIGLDGNQYDIKILAASFEMVPHNQNHGMFMKPEKMQLVVTTCDGLIRIQTLQLQGRKIMNTADFMRGYGHLFPEMQAI